MAKYIYSIGGGGIALVVFVITAFLTPVVNYNEEIKTMLTINTFLFAILAGFFISRSNSRYDNIREYLSTEDALWLSVYELSKTVGGNFQKKMRSLIDEYYVLCYDYEDQNYYKPTQKVFLQIYNIVNELYKKTFKTKGKRPADTSLSRIYVYLGGIEEVRNKTSVLLEEKVTNGKWVVLFLLSAIIIFSVYHLRTFAFYTQVIAVILSTTLVLVLLILRDLQNLRLGGEVIASESGQEVLETIGTGRYYSQYHIIMGEIPEDIGPYRLGLHRPGEKQKIKWIRRDSDSIGTQRFKTEHS
ncbi:MAG: hypothetical protein NUV97_03580 [archaeon]|nr:hypothetical protein [archaeon]MCR4323901.1 hypothetical protein [Nanoarchaeota archaeon]